MLEAKIVKGKSKSGNEYYAVDIQLTPDYKMRVFLKGAEEALVKATYNDI